MAIVIILLYMFLGLILFVAISTLFWLPIPFLSHSEGKDTVQGSVSSGNTLNYSVMEIRLRQELHATPLFGGFGAIVSSKGLYIHRRCRYYPFKRGCVDLVEVQISKRHYRLRGRSLCWIKNWKSLST